jgi:hypothetical protein
MLPAQTQVNAAHLIISLRHSEQAKQVYIVRSYGAVSFGEHRSVWKAAAGG